jgi:AcrR family transcriptional regulator
LTAWQGAVNGLTIDISSELVEQVAERAAQLLAKHRQPSGAPESLLTVDQLAAILATTPEWVRRHQAELGAFRLSDGGGRNPIRFRASDVERFLAARRLKPRAKASARGWRDDPDWALG